MRIMVARTRALAAVVLVAAVAGAAGCGGGDNAAKTETAASNKPVTLTFWGWDPSIQNAVKLYEKAHPNVTVRVVNAGFAADEYTKFRAAMKAGKSDPDVIMLDFTETPSLRAEGLLRNLSQLGADEVRDEFAPWYMRLLEQGSDGLYGLPLDAGLLGLVYREDIFARYGLTPPKTWAQFATTAEKLHRADPSTYLTDFPISFDWLTPLMYQRGWRPFQVDGSKISIHVDSQPALDVAAYWDDLIAKGAVKPGALYSSSWFSGIDRDRYASMIAAEWLPALIESTSDTFGKWRAAPLPQWSAGEHVTPLWGGSVYAVSAKSDHPVEAAELVKYVTSTKSVVDSNNEKVPYAFYPLKSLYESPAWRNERMGFYGPQKANRVFGSAAEHVTDDIQFAPFQDFVLEQGDQLFGDALKNGTSLVDAIRKLQPIVVDYAKRQGFEVSG
ncbi:MAG: ABC transporter substrate-binding protein [Conexibacter sp.]